MVFNERLAELRSKTGLSQKDFANKHDIEPSKYNKWENGKAVPDLTTICNLADIFDVSVDYLVGNSIYKKMLNEQKIRDELSFFSFLSSVGYALVEPQVSKWHYGEAVDEHGNKEQIVDEWLYSLIKNGETVSFTQSEYEEMQNAVKDVIDTRFYKKLMKGDSRNAT